MLNAVGPHRLLRIFSHSNAECLSASGDGDAHDYAVVKPEDFVGILKDLKVDFKQFSGILIGGCTSAQEGDEGQPSTAQRIALASGLPTFGSVAYMGYNGYLSLSVISGFDTVYFSLRLLIYPFAKPGSPQLLHAPWLYFPPKQGAHNKVAKQILAALNEGSPQMGSEHPQFIRFDGEFTSTNNHPEGPICLENIAPMLIRIKPRTFHPLPAGIFPGL